MDKETLVKYEPKLARLFINSRKQNRLANAYLLYGDNNAPLKEIGMYLAQSLNCEKDYLACNNCSSCQRFLKDIRPDFYLIDGQENLIKKDDVKSLEKSFSMSALEKGHTLTYLINRVDNMTEEAINSLLKFLEEPKSGQIAFLTTTNITKVLPTIISRCILIRVDPIEVKKFYSDLQSLTYKDKKNNDVKLSMQEAYILSRFFNSKDEVEKVLNEDSSILLACRIAESFFNDLSFSYKQGSYTLLKEISQISDNKCYNWLYLILELIFSKCLIDEVEEDNPFNSVIKLLKKYKNLNKAIEVIKQAISLKQVNLNPTLQLSRMLLSLDEEKSR